ncbi:hypothetical protein GCM10009332_14240 [Shewanella gelidii]|uniref:PH domain-containing protein n=2 Tax=Shewanella gelidii TaxID=1642821 RepID=A0A917JMX3_9GAMM|nr:hypothetical protein GCM10009332_14240 [Shewanella gelidii]
MHYKNTQLAKAMLAIIGIVSLLLLLASFSKPNEPTGYIFILFAIIAILFSSLTISVENGKILWFFGPRFWNKSLEISQIESARVIETKWYNGLGIRLISTGWLYNVSGLTAVELKLKDGTIISLGTDDADNLVQAINAAKQHAAAE